MSSISRKYVCPGCFRSARATRRDIVLICGYCEMLMKYVPPYGKSENLQDELVEEVNDDVQK